MESHCLFPVGLSSLLKKKKHFENEAAKLFWHFLNILKLRAMPFGAILCCSFPGGFRLPIPWVLQFAGEGVGTCYRHSLHRTGYTENNRQRTVDSQGVACLSSLWLFSFVIFRLVYTGLVSSLIFRPRSPSCMRSAFADFWSLKGSTIFTGAFCFSGTCCWVCESSDTFQSMNWRMVDCTSLSG